jgi:hypothetical protein
MTPISNKELAMNNDHSISFGLLLSVEPLDINRLHLNDDEGREKLVWQADNTDHNNPSFFSKILRLFKF